MKIRARKIYNITAMAVIIISVLLLAAYNAIYLKNKTDLIYAEYTREQAIKDAEEAIKRQDIFVYVTGTIACKPAVESKYAELAKSLPSKPLACGCVIDDYKLRRVQVRYARTYNRLIMKHVWSRI
jgi:hypothetical protein